MTHQNHLSLSDYTNIIQNENVGSKTCWRYPHTNWDLFNGFCTIVVKKPIKYIWGDSF